LSAAQRRGGGEPEQYVPVAIMGCMENVSLNTGANCRRYICTVLHNVMWFWIRELFMHKTCIKIYIKSSLFYRLGDKKRRPKILFFLPELYKF
jgi:hypothetical protein